MQFDEVDKAMIQVVKWHIKVIFCVLTNRNCHFFQVDKATIQMAEWHLKVIFCLLTSPKFDFLEVEKTIFQVVATQSDLVFFLLTSPKAKWWSQESFVSRGRMSLWTHIRPLHHPKMRHTWVLKAMFQGLEWNSQLIFGLWTSWKCNFIKTKKRCFKWSPGNQN